MSQEGVAKETRAFSVPIRLEERDAPVTVGGMLQIVGGGIAERVVQEFMAHPGDYNLTITVTMEKL